MRNERNKIKLSYDKILQQTFKLLK